MSMVCTVLTNRSYDICVHQIYIYTSTVTPVGGRISRTGLVAYFPPEIWVKNQGILSKEGVDRSYIEYYYGIVNNVGSSSTTVELELSFKIHPTAPPMNVTTLWAVMNNGTVELGVSDNYFHIGKNVSHKIDIHRGSSQ